MSGIGRYLRYLMPVFLSQENNQYILLGNPDELTEYANLNNVEIRQIKSKIYSPFEHFELAKIVPPCDIYFSPFFITPALKIRATRRITTIHDFFHLSEQADFSFLKRLYVKLLYRIAIRKSDRIITISNFSKNELVKHFPIGEQKTTIIYNFVDRDHFKYSGENPYPDEKYILYVGNIKPHKNLVRLVKAFNQLKVSNVKLVIVGDRDGLINGIEGFDDLIAANNNIIFTGRISDNQLISLYSFAQFLAFPSLYEGMGAPPLEAMSCGTAVMASSISVIKEICRDGALYCDPMSIEDIRNKMSQLLENEELKNEYILKGEKVCSSYSRDTFIERHLELFNGFSL